MTNRVLLNASGLKVSKPGFDVLTTGPGGLNFSSDWAQFGVYLQGYASAAWAVSGQVGTWSAAINLGKTFASPPAVFFERDCGSGAWLPLGGASGFVYFVTSSFSPPPDRSLWVVGKVTTSQILFSARYEKRTSGFAQPQFAVRYTVYNQNL